MHFTRILLFTLLSFVSISVCAQENCTNGIDDDNDGLIDLNDPDCACSGNSGTPTSIIPNPSFESLNCCPSNFSELYCATNWVQASDATSDLLNTCDYVGATGSAGLLPFPDGNGAIAFLGLSDYKEYIGSCLTSPMNAGTAYTLQFSLGFTGLEVDPITFDVSSCQGTGLPSSMDMVLYGTANCINLPYFGLDCPLASLSSYSIIGTASFSLLATGYQLITMNFTPTFNVNEIVLGFPCNLPSGWPSNTDGLNGDCMPYVIVDNLILNTTGSFGGISISTQGSACDNNLVLIANSSSSGSYQWYTNGIAIAGQTNSTLNFSTLGLGSGTYNLRFDDGTDCYIDSIIVNNQLGSSIAVNDAQICKGETAILTAFGGVSYSWSPSAGLNSTNTGTVSASPNTTTNYIVSGTSANGCAGSATSVVTVIPSPDDATVNIVPFPVETEANLIIIPNSYSYTWISPENTISTGPNLYYEFDGDGLYEFTVIAENSNGCTHEFIVPISVNSDILVYVPNAFTPDKNEYNDLFVPIISEKLDKQSYLFTIYDRWGQIVFQSQDIAIGWDGTYNQKKVESGIYSWSIELKIKNIDERRSFSGHVTVLN